MRRLAGICTRHRGRTFLVWLVLLVGCGFAAGAAGSKYSTNFELPSSDSQRALQLLEQQFPQQSGGEVQVVFAARDGKLTDPAAQRQVESVVKQVAGVDGIASIASPFSKGGAVSPDGTVALATAELTTRSFDVSEKTTNALFEIRQKADGGGNVEVELGGDAIRDAQQSDSNATEVIGLLAAIIVLLLMFGSVVAMVLPVLTAMVALGIALSIVTLVTHVFDTADFAPQLAAMIGLGVGIDYALFVVTRFRSGLRAGLEPDEAVLVAMDTAGRAVLLAGATVCVALLGLFAVGVSFLYGPALASALAVLVTMAASLTLLPAMLSKVGTRIDRLRLPGMRGSCGEEGRLWSRWSRLIQQRPWPAAIGTTALLLALAIPILSIHIGNPDAGTDQPNQTTRKAYDLLAQGFGAGFNGPLLVVSDMQGVNDPKASAAELQQQAEGIDGVATATAPVASPSGSVELIRVFPTTGPQDQATQDLVTRLRDQLLTPFDAKSGAVSHLGGEAAITDDFNSYIAGKMPLFFGIVILLSALLLLVAFRSLLVPLKAVLMNVLSIGASFGVVVAVFQHGWGASLIGVSETAPIPSFLPIFVFAIVFGLSMDYEVFLMSRVREEWDKRGDASDAVQHGLASTGRVITAAATIMIVVFASFALGDNFIVKLFGVGLAAAIAIDAFLIRSLLVPAIMELFGRRAWWLPGWLDRSLPRVRIEAEEPTPAPTPAPTGAGAER